LTIYRGYQMNNTFLAEDFQKIMNKLTAIAEADTGVGVDKTVDDLMTTEKKPVNRVSTSDVTALASDLGVENPDTFNAAFKNIRVGKMPEDSDQLKELAIAFDKILSGDASTTGRVISQLRDLYNDTAAVNEKQAIEEKEEHPGKKDIKRVYKGNEGWVYQPTSAEGARYLLRNTKSDLATADSKFDAYIEIGPIYVVFDKENRERYTVQPSQHMAVDSSDRRVDLHSLPDWSQPHLK
jgi:hypothetical protein